jgi:cytidylate kinase
MIPRERYISHLRRVILRAAYGAKVVFIGRGAQFFLPRHRGLAVRVIAPESYRVRSIAKERGIGEKEARARMYQTDSDRAEFVRHYFRFDIDDPHIYDLVINVEHLSHDRIAEEIARFCGTWEASRSGKP